MARKNPDEKLEGNRPLPNSSVIIEFPALELAKASYYDTDYAPLITLRQTGSTTEITLIDGLE